MPHNRSRFPHQMSVSAPTLEVCLLPREQPDVTSSVVSSAPRFAFFLTRSPDFGIMKHTRCDTDTEGGSANTIARRWCPASSNKIAEADTVAAAGGKSSADAKPGLRW